MKQTLITLAPLFAALTLLTSCEKEESRPEKVAEEIGEAIEEIGDELKQ